MSEDATKKRRTQAERSAETRARMLEATVRCLRERGYAATTTLLVAEEAGVSRGAMLHQFPTKVDLMLFVVREVYRDELRAYARLLDALPDDRARLSAIPEVVWEVLSRPAGVAVLEIMLGSRSDPVLAERLGPLQQEIEADSFAQVRSYERSLGREIPTAYIRLVVWAVRGLSIAQMLTTDADGITDSVRFLRQLLESQFANLPPKPEPLKTETPGPETPKTQN